MSLHLKISLLFLKKKVYSNKSKSFLERHIKCIATGKIYTPFCIPNYWLLPVTLHLICYQLQTFPSLLQIPY